MAPRTRCLGVDDHPVVRQGLDLLFGHLDDLELVGTAETGEEALEAVSKLNPQIVLIDVRLPGIDGISAVKRIHEAAPGVSFVVFSAYGDKRLLSDAIAAGARGYVMKGSPPEDLLRAIRTVAEGQAFVDPSLSPPGGLAARDPHCRGGQGVRGPVALARAADGRGRPVGPAALRARARDPPA